MMRLGKPSAMRWGGGKREGEGSGGRQSRRPNPSGSSGASTSSSGSGSGGKDCKNAAAQHQAPSIASLGGNKKALWKCIERGDWDAVRATLRTKKGQAEAAKVAFTGQSVLAKALQCHKVGLPVDIVHRLVEAAPKALNEVDLWGQLPLHVACKEGASYEVFSAVLQLGGPAATISRCGEGRTPLHYAVRQACKLSDTLTAANALLTCGSSSSERRGHSGGEKAQEKRLRDSHKTDDGPCDMDGVTYTGGSVSSSAEEGERIMREMVDVIVSLAFCSPRAILMEDKNGETPWDVVLLWIEGKVIENNNAPLQGHCVVLQDQLRRILRHAIAWNTVEGEFDDGSDEEMPDKQKASQSAKKAKAKSFAEGGAVPDGNAAAGAASQHGNPSQSQGRISVPWRSRAGAATVEEPNDDDDHTEVMSEDSNDQDSTCSQR